ncbi:MAG: hypothetical protein JF589_15575, partial [Gemmatimonadetes bacterium]|nr:hypothetical protein [Gemmatimonadota bacterium]
MISFHSLARRRDMGRVGRALFIAALIGAADAAPISAQSTPNAGAGAPPFPVSIRVDASRPLGELKPIWRFFGADEPNYA